MADRTSRIITLPNGQQVKITGDREPTAEDLQAIMASMEAPTEQRAPYQNIMPWLREAWNDPNTLENIQKFGGEVAENVRGMATPVIRGLRDAATETGQALMAEGEAGAGVGAELGGAGPALVRGIMAELPQMGPNTPRATRREGPRQDVELPREDYSTPFQQYGPGRLTQAPTPGSTGEADAGLSDPATMFRQNVGGIADFVTGVPGAGSYNTQALKEGWQSLDPIRRDEKGEVITDEAGAILSQGLPMLNVIGLMPAQALRTLTAKVMGVSPEVVGRVTPKALRAFWLSEDAAAFRQGMAKHVDEMLESQGLGADAMGRDFGFFEQDFSQVPEEVAALGRSIAAQVAEQMVPGSLTPAGRMVRDVPGAIRRAVPSLSGLAGQAMTQLDERFGPQTERVMGQVGDVLSGAQQRVGEALEPVAGAVRGAGRQVQDVVGGARDLASAYRGLPTVPRAPALPRTAPLEAPQTMADDLLRETQGGGVDVVEAANAAIKAAEKEAAARIRGYRSAGWTPKNLQRAIRQEEQALEASRDRIMNDALAGKAPPARAAAPETPLEAPGGAPERPGGAIDEGVDLTPPKAPIEAPTPPQTPPAAAGEAIGEEAGEAAAAAVNRASMNELTEAVKAGRMSQKDAINEMARRMEAARSGGTTAAATALPRGGGKPSGRGIGSEKGFAKLFTDPAANTTAITGGTIGGSLGALSDEENRWRGAAKGIALGVIPGVALNEADIFRKGVNAIPGAPFKTAFDRTMRYGDQMRQGFLLSGLATPKSWLGATFAPGIKVAETASQGRIGLALKQAGEAVGAIPAGLKDALHVLKTAESPMFVASPNQVPTRGIAGLPRWAMATGDAPARKILSEMTPTPEDAALAMSRGMSMEDLAARDLLSGAPQTTALNAIGNMFKGNLFVKPRAPGTDPSREEQILSTLNKYGPLVRHHVAPVGFTTASNLLEQGAQRTPGLNFLTQALVPSLAQSKRQIRGNTLMGLGAMGAGYYTDATVPQEDWTTRMLRGSAAGKYGFPFGMGMAAHRFLDDPDAGPVELADIVVEQALRDNPVQIQRLFSQNPVKSQAESWIPSLYKLFTGQR